MTDGRTGRQQGHGQGSSLLYYLFLAYLHNELILILPFNKTFYGERGQYIFACWYPVLRLAALQGVGTKVCVGVQVELNQGFTSWTSQICFPATHKGNLS